MSMIIKRSSKKLEPVHEEVRKPKLKWFSYKSNPNLQQLVDIFHCENFRTDSYGAHMKSKNYNTKGTN